ncbi:MAG: hypothetical protein Q9170_005743 [Blastenia crenularia]
MDTTRLSTPSMSRETALHHLGQLIDTPEEVLFTSILVSAYAKLIVKATGITSDLQSSYEVHRHLIDVSGVSNERLTAGMNAFNLLYEACRALGLPNTQSPSEFGTAWRKMGARFPFYEQYTISAGRAKELISNAELAHIMGTRLDDPDSLNEYRKVLRLARSDAGASMTPVAEENGQEYRLSKKISKSIEQMLVEWDVPSSTGDDFVHVQRAQSTRPRTFDASVQTYMPQTASTQTILSESDNKSKNTVAEAEPRHRDDEHIDDELTDDDYTDEEKSSCMVVLGWTKKLFFLYILVAFCALLVQYEVEEYALLFMLVYLV